MHGRRKCVKKKKHLSCKKVTFLIPRNKVEAAPRNRFSCIVSIYYHHVKEKVHIILAANSNPKPCHRILTGHSSEQKVSGDGTLSGNHTLTSELIGPLLPVFRQAGPVVWISVSYGGGELG